MESKDKSLLIMLMKACINTYNGRHGKVRKVFDRVEFHESGNVIWHEGDLDGKKYIIFEGTHNKYGWIKNIKYNLVVSFNHGLKKIHEGFKDEFDMCFYDVLNVCKRCGCPVIFAGHSKGGALAILLASSMAHYKVDVRACASFAGPRVGGRYFRRWYNKLNIPTFIIRVKNDPVPLLPFKTIGYFFSLLRYVHVVKVTRIGKITWRDWWECITTNPLDHEPERYLRYLEEL